VSRDTHSKFVIYIFFFMYVIAIKCLLLPRDRPLFSTFQQHIRLDRPFRDPKINASLLLAHTDDSLVNPPAHANTASRCDPHLQVVEFARRTNNVRGTRKNSEKRPPLTVEFLTRQTKVK